MFRSRCMRFLLPPTLLAVSVIPNLCRAQSPSNMTVLVSGLEGPRGLAFGPDGDLYVAEAGTGGTTSISNSVCTQVIPPVGPYTNGKTARISRIDMSGNRTTVASGFPSAYSAAGSEGVSDVAFIDGTLYALIAGGGCSHGSVDIPNGIARVNLKSGKWTILSDLSLFYAEHPVKNPSDNDFEPDGVPYNLLVHRDRLIVVEPNHGDIEEVARDGATRRLIDVSASQGHIVPTSIAERDGIFYLGTLNLFPILPLTSQVLLLGHQQDCDYPAAPGFDCRHNWRRLNVLSSKAGFTTVVSTKFGPDGLLYVLELSAADGYPAPGAGKVVRVTAEGEIEDVVTGLAVPTAMTFGPDGKLYISNLGAAPPGAGQIVRVDLP